MIEEILSFPRHDESSKETGLNRIKRKRMISSIMTGFFYAGAFGAALLLTIFVGFVIGQGFLSVNPDIPFPASFSIPSILWSWPCFSAPYGGFLQESFLQNTPVMVN